MPFDLPCSVEPGSSLTCFAFGFSPRLQIVCYDQGGTAAVVLSLEDEARLLAFLQTRAEAHALAGG